MCEISIIVPVYNVEKYLKKCVDSILNQTFKDFELILVDDGSPDNSGMICDEYAEQDSRVRVIHKENGGLSDARNAGIDVAKGKYIGFVDSDDYIAEDMYELLYRNIIKEDADLSICGIYDVYPGKTLKKKELFYKVLDSIETMILIFHGNNISVHAVNKLYRSHLFSSIRYPLGKYHEDSFIIVDIIDLCNKIVIDSTQSYYYYHRVGSINTEKFSERQFDFIEAWTKNEKKVIGRNNELDIAAHQRVCFAYFLVLDKIIKSNSENNIAETKKIVSFLRRNYFFIIRNSIFTVQRKVSMSLLMFSVKMYKLVTTLKTS
ncbi:MULTISPECIES: glycosyltransferase family 2 protein [Enterococcus]|uniref:Glycosyltransferase n=1 Tax=Candidatus Enterococcus murrayae TaxID=2815321 RepID=A0ABS3HLH5_9ENTE|nr:glycosyltransferase [Enterococcus sp. MJM16]MBO0454297.1 glycosyltransferase [Enterococcus sp. MJM16]